MSAGAPSPGPEGPLSSGADRPVHARPEQLPHNGPGRLRHTGPQQLPHAGPDDEQPRERWAVRLALAPIRVYQRVISPALPRRCKYHPTCSAYAVQAIRSYGILRGSVLAAWRLLRCNPFSHGGYDPVAAQTLFRRRPRSHSTSASHS